MSTKLHKIAMKARADKSIRFTSLAHLLTSEFLIETWNMMNRKGACGIDKVSMEEFGIDLTNKIGKLIDQLKEGTYKPLPVRRVEIPKNGNTKETRPLGIPTVEDRLIQKAVSRILEAIFEEEFLDCSFGFRPGQGPHAALSKLRSHIVANKVSQIYEADIKGYFNNINHHWLRKMLEHRIADPVVLRLVGKWLKAGVMTNGVVVVNSSGTPQGGPISCVLSNIYLHYVLDLWFEKRIKPIAQGQANLIRFVDDFVACFQYKRDATEFEKKLAERMQKFSLELVPDKTKRISFGRFARERERKFGVKAGSFVFLGFNHVCGEDKNGNFSLIRIPGHKSCRKFLDKVHDWFRCRFHWKVRDQQKHLSVMLRGFYRYFSLVHCDKKLNWIRREVHLIWRRSLRRRGQRQCVHWSYLTGCDWFELPYPPSTAIHQFV